jgi:hypothetical protein
LIQGTTHIINTLYADGLYVPGAGQEDWLPCCPNTRDYINGSIMAAVNWPNINQKMMFDCSCPSGSTEGLQNYWAPAAQGVGYIPAAGGKYYMYGSKDWYYDPSYYGFPGQVGVKAFQPLG